MFSIIVIDRVFIVNDSKENLTCLIDSPINTTYTHTPPMYVAHSAELTSILTKLANLRTLGGPYWNAACAVSAYVIDGVFVRLHITWEDLTSMWTQCAQRKPRMMVPIPPKSKPPFLTAFGIARIPEPSDDFIRCAKAPKSLYFREQKNY